MGIEIMGGHGCDIMVNISEMGDNNGWTWYGGK